jgi:hypothetical protein
MSQTMPKAPAPYTTDSAPHASPKSQEQSLHAALEIALLHELQQAHQQLNAVLFNNSLRPVVLALTDTSSILGRWHSETRTIEINRAFAIHQPWVHVIEVLKHEMAHQFVDQILGQKNDGHGELFRSVCQRFCIDPRASGLPNAHPPSEQEERVLSRVARLLALADSPNTHEAHAAMSAAQRLMLRYNIDQARLASGQSRYEFRQVGHITGRIQESERILAALLIEHFFVNALWVQAYVPMTGKSGSVLELCGTPANLEMAEYVYAFLSHTAQQLWNAHQKSTKCSGRDRQTYLAGVMLGFRERLARESTAQQCEGLVWAGDPGLDAYLRARHPHTRRLVRYGNRRTQAREHGKRAGREIVLRRPFEAQPTNDGRLLPSKSR